MSHEASPGLDIAAFYRPHPRADPRGQWSPTGRRTRAQRRLPRNVEQECGLRDGSIGPLAQTYSTVVARIEATADLASRCDRQLFREAFYCLAENAFQAASVGPNEQRSVDIHAQRSDDRLRIRVAVLDSGAGVHPEDRDRVFAPRVTTKKGGDGHPLGTGMGLPIARKYAELMGGRIGIDASAAQTCFFLELPASPETDA